MTVVYGTALSPGTPGTWQRDVWWALNRCARVGRGTGRHRWRFDPPFRFKGDGRTLAVMAGTPKLPYGRSTHGRGHLTHMPHTMLFAWDGPELVGWMVAWHCGARTAYFRTMDEPDSPLCPMCIFRAGQS